ncbi:bile salt-activated lipase-like isoform X2 [Trichoplusia ni]|uniref:Bile salt-activated lipase-like isoform X2 n=1 Tax=Trichoplusia ni TaxID=7111 RepID=A0A7E5X503_TRINI|nr:bile salt-activated lipase-like isoform X2 [Trichoplusia ni]
MKNLLLVLLLTTSCWAGQPRVDPLVSTARGLIRGLRAEDGDYDMFLGIPYAVVDEHDPFGPATPHPGFNTTFEANNDDTQCAQFDKTIFGTIQCLQLNVYVPNKAGSSHTLPVMVYIHGGAFLRGSKKHKQLSPKFLIRHDVIIVNFNYRIGLYGFLCTSEDRYKNQGLKDQILAFKWVKDNIAAFGGDVNKITAFGESAGAMGLDLQLLGQEKLAQRVILQSGTSLTPWLIGPEADNIPLEVANYLGYEGEDVKEAVAYIETTVITAVNDLQVMNTTGHPRAKPCVEKANSDAILKDYPINLKPNVKGMDIMIGHNSQEVMFIYPNSDEEFYKNYKFGTELIQGFDDTYDEQTVRQFYLGDDQPSSLQQDAILTFASDFAFVHPSERNVLRYLEANAKSVYRYMFSYEGGRNLLKVKKNLTSAGASHGDELGYLFSSDTFPEVPDERDQYVIDVITKLWTDFAKYGNPTPETTELIPVKWTPVIDNKKRPYLNIDNPVRLESRVFHDRMAFWDLYYKLNGDKIKGYRGI